MRAMVMREFGPPEVLEERVLDTPVPGPGEVLVAVEAAGICHHDVLDRAGKIPGAQPGHVLGHEVAGRIVAGGDVAQRGRLVAMLNRVSCGRCRFCTAGRQDLCRSSAILGSDRQGGYAELISVPEAGVVPVPEAVSAADAAFAACPVGTSVRAVLTVAQTRPGDIVLVNGASGGLGLHQIQVAKAAGARVIAVTSSDRKVEAIRGVGADEVVVSPDLDYSREVWTLTGKQGVDVVMENVGTATMSASLRSMAQGGILVLLGNIGVAPVTVDPGLLIGRRLRIEGSGGPVLSDIKQGLELMATGRVTPVVAATLPFPEVAKAHELMEGRDLVGRVLLEGW